MTKADSGDLRELLGKVPPAGSRFRHYKGSEYVVVGAAILEATLEPIVLYCPAEGAGRDICWARPLSVWDSRVQVGAEEVPRFRKIDVNRSGGA